ncbi:MAG: type IV pili twitching motility protein PilT [Proteobacteria bacterium]|nr:MAG: type IV pili twitching motility protein PilT [Pseudomonadota bacterium]
MTGNHPQITAFLNAMVKHEASDLYLTTGAKASIKVMGGFKHLTKEPMKPGLISALTKSMLSDIEWESFKQTKEINKGFALRGIGRFRMNAYHQRGEVSVVIRHVRSEIMDPDTLGLPAVLKELVMQKDGLLLFVGSTGAGKSTSMASLIQYRNERHAGHILTIEDPIEFVFRHDKSIIGQREVGFDTLSYQNAMREAMREAPDVVMVGEVRDTETVNSAMGFADTGHLVITTLHATNTIQALDRLLYLFPAEQKQRVLMDLSINLRGIVAQRLIPDSYGRRVLASEVLINTPFVSEIIRKGNTHELQQVIEKGSTDGMHTFDQSLVNLCVSGRISKKAALEHATSKNNLEWRLNFEQSSGTGGKNNSAASENELPALEM